MKKIIVLFFSVFLFFYGNSQKIPGRLNFEQGQVLEIDLQIKTTIAQQAMGQAIDFTINADAKHSYKVLNTTEDNTTLHHKVDSIRFVFDGMGQKTKFDSGKEKDMNGQFGKTIKELLNNKYDIIIDPGGTVLLARPEKVEIKETDNRMAIINSLLKDIIHLVQPPLKGSPSFFKFLPAGENSVGDTWTTADALNGGKQEAAYKISEINDSTVVIDFIENSITVTKANMMGSETLTTMNNKSTGKIILNRSTGIIREKTSTTESNGNTEGGFGTVPVTSKTTTIIKVMTK